MTERDIEPQTGAGSGPGTDPAAVEQAGRTVEAPDDRSPVRVVGRSTQQTAALRRQLAEKAAATDELREALDELRQVLDVENPPPVSAARRRRGRVLLILLIALAVVAAVVVALLGRGGSPIVGSTSSTSPAGASSSASAGTTSAPATSAPTSAGAAGTSTTGVHPMAWPGGAVINPPGLTTSGPGATAPGTDVQMALDDDGTHLDVIERLLLPASTTQPLVLTLPSLPALTQTQVSQLQVQLDGQTVAAVADPDGTSWTATAAGGHAYTRAVLRYRISDGMVDVTPAASGRAFAVVTPLTALISQGHQVPVIVRSVDRHVIGVSCPAIQGTGSVCGNPVAGGWAATLPINAQPIVLFQVNR